MRSVISNVYAPSFEAEIDHLALEQLDDSVAFFRGTQGNTHRYLTAHLKATPEIRELQNNIVRALLPLGIVATTPIHDYQPRIILAFAGSQLSEVEFEPQNLSCKVYEFFLDTVDGDRQPKMLRCTPLTTSRAVSDPLANRVLS
jgi:hypothetical protein